MRFKQRALVVAGLILVLLAGPAYNVASGKVSLDSDWRNKSRESAGIAPDPAQFKDAVVQVYSARAFSWRGAFGVHTWIAVKPENAGSYTVLDVQMWRRYRSRPVLKIYQSQPDMKWVGNAPELLANITGDEASSIIPRIIQLAEQYPFANEYRVWPGPNSNTFTAYIGRGIPQLSLDLPPTAIGKDYFRGRTTNQTPSGNGFQFALAGLVGVILSIEEGIEINILGLSFGFNPLDLELRLPGIGILGFNS